MLKRILILLLTLAMCVGVLVGCSKEEENKKPNDIVGGTDEEFEVDDDEIGKYDFKGAEFNIFTRSETSYEHDGSYGTDMINQAIYDRNSAVEQRFNVLINIKSMAGDWYHQEDFITALRAESMAPTGAYDLVSTHSVYLGWMGAEGMMYDLTKLPEIDPTKSYWNQNLYRELNVDGACYMMIGDIGHTLYEYITVMFVNTGVLEDRQLIENDIQGLYELVDNGGWTWDVLYEMAKEVGDGVESYGLLMNTHALRASLVGEDVHIFTRDSQTNRFYMTSAATEHTIAAVEKLSKFFRQDNMYFTADGDWSCGEGELNPIFAAGGTLFYPQMLGQAMTIQESMGDNYSIVPLPKYDEFQSDYYTICRDTVTGVAVMNCAKDATMSGVITQALCYYASEYVTPEYYEKALKYRYNSDPKVVEILDMIRDSLTIEAVPTYFDTGIDADMFRDIIKNGKTEGVASTWLDYQSQGNTLIQKFYVLMDAMKEE